VQHFPLGGLFGERIDTLRVGRWSGLVGYEVGKVIMVMDLI
jgi:hypothetical protein